jgi:farnesyl diphosphate synthase
MTLSVDGNAFAARLKNCAGEVEDGLRAVLGDVAGADEVIRPARLLAAMRHGALAGGKRLRPFLVVEAVRAMGSPHHAGALRAGIALELVHCYSLVHDDLPAMDNDDLRRGKPTVHRAFDEATAILAGDGLLTLAFDVLADPLTHPDGTVRANLVGHLARAAGFGGMVGGQMLDLAAEGRCGGDGTPLSLDLVLQLQAMKTGALIQAAVIMAAIHAGATAAQTAALKHYGKAAGVAFQIADDILDVEASAEAMGKATAKDSAAGKATLVSLMGLDSAKRERDRQADAAVAALDAFGPEADMLRAAALFIARRSS